VRRNEILEKSNENFALGALLRAFPPSRKTRFLCASAPFDWQFA
jgi:hypothetical protein